MSACHFSEQVMAGEAAVTHEIDPLTAEDDFYGPAQAGPHRRRLRGDADRRAGMTGGGGDGGGGE